MTGNAAAVGALLFLAGQRTVAVLNQPLTAPPNAEGGSARSLTREAVFTAPMRDRLLVAAPEQATGRRHRLRLAARALAPLRPRAADARSRPGCGSPPDQGRRIAWTSCCMSPPPTPRASPRRSAARSPPKARRWGCFLTNDGVRAFDDKAFAAALAGAARVAVCEHSWAQHMHGRACPAEQASQTLNSALMAEAERVVSL